ncbi:MAG: phosphotransferase, partial [Woeseiaceae bacterium]|nr:phosphotransferase [Woeseiaceae bacterium]
MTTDDPFKVLETQPPVVSPDEAARVLELAYGRRGELKPLRSERDLNFGVTGENTERFVLKFSNSAEAPSISRLQANALLHIERVAPELPVPRNLATSDGNVLASFVAEDGRRHAVRLLSWLDGVPVDETDHAPRAASTLGDCLARVGKALHTFDDPAADYALLWDLKNAASLANLLGNLDDKALRALCADALTRFEEIVLPRLDTLRWQIIHNDLNPGNVLVEPGSGRLAGIIDFGDIVRSPLVVDVAVACAYLLRDGDDTLADIRAFVAAYSAVRPLADDETAILFDLVRTRLAMTILIARWRAARYPENRDYILCSEPEA